ncbi:unnamed protein product [Pylaiella littoralis]
MGAIRTALETSVLGTVRVFVVLLAGFLASKFPTHEPLLTKETCRCISRVCALLFLPALMISSTGATLNPTALRDAWQLVVAGSFTIVFSGIVAWLAGRVFFRRPEDRRAFSPVGLAIAFPNSASFPLLLMDALCEQDNIKSDFDDDAVQCFSEATGMIFIYVVVWQVWFYGWGFYALGQDETLEKQLTGEPTKTQTPPLAEIDIPSHGKSSFDALPQEANAGGAGSGGITGAQARATAEVDGVVVIDIDQCREEGSNTTEVLAAPNADESGGERDDANDWAGLKKRVWRIVLSPNIIAVAIGVVIAMIAPLQTLLFDNPRAVLRPVGAAIETVGTPTVAVSTLVMAGSLVQVPTVAAASIATEGGPSGNSTLRKFHRFRMLVGFLHVVARLVVVPAVGFAVFWVARNRSSVMGENRLMHLILLIELAMPSAALVIVSLNQVRMPAAAGFIARLYVWQYGASMLTITAWTALAVHLVY